MNNKTCQLTKDQYRKLVSFLGYGDFMKADIIFFGNEEGAGGYSIEANINVRCNVYGKNKVGEYVNLLVDNEWEKGYWECQSMEDDTSKIKSFFTESDKMKRQHAPKGGFLYSAARICKALEDKENNLFPFSNDIIKGYLSENNLFRKREGIQSALVDWCPLPRKNQSDWPPEYQLIDKKKYLDAFQKLPRKNGERLTDEFSNYMEDVDTRLSLLEELFQKSPAKVIVGFGGVNEMKKNVFERLYGESIFNSIEFKTVDMGNLKSSKAIIFLPNKTLHIYLLPFPQAGLVFKNNRMLFGCIQEITEEIKGII